MAIFGFALAFTISCTGGEGNDDGGNNAEFSSSSLWQKSSSSLANSSSSGNEQSYNYCIIAGNTCLTGPFTASTCTGQLSNNCPNGSSPSSSGSSSSVPSSSSATVSSSSSSSVPNQTGIIRGTPVTYEGEIYETVVIGTQTWMAENLNYDVTGSMCYGDPANCNTYGRLYDWATAMALDASCNSSSCSEQIKSKHQGICPHSWHIPSDEEWTTLTDYVGGVSTAGTKLKAREGWNSYRVPLGSDTYGFAALPGGCGTSGGSFIYVGLDGYWWSATETNATDAYYRRMGSSYEYVNRDYDRSKSLALFSVRCVQD